MRKKKVKDVFQNFNNDTGELFRICFEGEEARDKTLALDIVDNWWKRWQSQCLQKWQKNTFNLKVRDTQRRDILIRLNNIKEKHANTTVSNEVISKFKTNRAEKLHSKRVKKVQSIVKLF